MLKLTCVIAFMSLILVAGSVAANPPIALDGGSQEAAKVGLRLVPSLNLKPQSSLKPKREFKYPLAELQERAIANSAEIQVINQAVKVMKAKKWTALAPGVGIGNNFVGEGDIRFNVNFNLIEMLGGGTIRQIDLDVARLILRKNELIGRLKLDVLEAVLALESAEREEAKYIKRLVMLEKRGRLLETRYTSGSQSVEAMDRYWDLLDSVEFKLQKAEDKIILKRARLDQLVGEW
jgi:hypothetical protein